ncbi:MAG: putative quinol monooxygenase [Acidimicrobiales bacterium]|jgi:quinol monooxygenase YgiN|nr:putative quinol monooxygenase [Acidimicrobiales bacterium]MEE1565418.1 putative quinol monooxygenase [Acidimicrobiales bacterium]|tara:strand:- start:1219 stop:1521 length:303 start_codon:yes stop_codon:yes gene_type:complete
MILIAGTISLDPDKVDEALAAIVPLMAATHAEDGCIDYVLSADPLMPGCIRIFEKWEGDEALAVHMKAPHMAAFQGKLGGLGVTGLSVERFDGATASKLF